MFDWSLLRARFGQCLAFDPGKEISGSEWRFHHLKEMFALLVFEDRGVPIEMLSESPLATPIGQLSVPTGRITVVHEEGAEEFLVEPGIYSFSVDLLSRRAGFYKLTQFTSELPLVSQLATTERRLSQLLHQAGRALRDCSGLPLADYDHRPGLVRCFDVDRWVDPRTEATAVTPRKDVCLYRSARRLGFQFHQTAGLGRVYYLWLAHPRCDDAWQLFPRYFLGIRAVVDSGCVVEVELLLPHLISDDDAVDCLMSVRAGFLEEQTQSVRPTRELSAQLHWGSQVLELQVPEGDWRSIEVGLFGPAGELLDRVQLLPLWLTTTASVVYQLWLLGERVNTRAVRVWEN